LQVGMCAIELLDACPETTVSVYAEDTFENAVVRRGSFLLDVLHGPLAEAQHEFLKQTYDLLYRRNVRSVVHKAM